MKHILNANFIVKILDGTEELYHVRGYEMPPSKRTIVAYSMSDKPSYHYVQFPYTYFFVFAKNIYGNYFRFHHLKIGFQSQPLTNSFQRLYKLALPNTPGGWVCFGNSKEKPKFPNMEQLSHDAISSFFSIPFSSNMIYIPLENLPPLTNFQQWHDASKQFDQLPIDFTEIDFETLSKTFQNIEFLRED